MAGCEQAGKPRKKAKDLTVKEDRTNFLQLILSRRAIQASEETVSIIIWARCFLLFAFQFCICLEVRNREVLEVHGVDKGLDTSWGGWDGSQLV